jgi:hypothetical protein
MAPSSRFKNSFFRCFLLTTRKGQVAGMLEKIDFRELPAGIYQIKVQAGNQHIIRNNPE